jgi:hypothetical protein
MTVTEESFKKEYWLAAMGSLDNVEQVLQFLGAMAQSFMKTLSGEQLTDEVDHALSVVNDLKPGRQNELTLAKS